MGKNLPYGSKKPRRGGVPWCARKRRRKWGSVTTRRQDLQTASAQGREQGRGGRRRRNSARRSSSSSGVAGGGGGASEEEERSPHLNQSIESNRGAARARAELELVSPRAYGGRRAAVCGGDFLSLSAPVPFVVWRCSCDLLAARFGPISPVQPAKPSGRLKRPN